MTFHVNFPRYQVETAYDQFQSPTQQKAEEIYQKYVNQKVPCELLGSDFLLFCWKFPNVLRRIHTLNAWQPRVWRLRVWSVF